MNIYNSINHVPKKQMYTKIYGTFESETEKAVCFNLDYGKVWFPKSKLIGVSNSLYNIQYYVQKWLLKNDNKVKVV